MKDEQAFTEEERNNLVGFFSTLIKVDRRLKREGYKFKNGKYIAPKKK
jgi:hypothetical protein